MTETEAQEVVAFMAATFNRVVDQAMMAGWWHAALHDVDQPEAMTVAIEMLNRSEFMPTPAAFNTTRAAMRRERYTAEVNAVTAQQALPAGETPAVQQRRFVTEMREALGRLGTKLGQHDHRGPSPCPVCGGINPTVRARMDQAAGDRCDLAAEAIRADQNARHGRRLW